MRFAINKSQLNENIHNFLRSFGYHPHQDPKTGEWSYVRRLSMQSFYPRFHLYVIEKNGGLIFDLHYDFKKPMHMRFANVGESDTEIVKKEAERIKSEL